MYDANDAAMRALEHSTAGDMVAVGALSVLALIGVAILLFPALNGSARDMPTKFYALAGALCAWAVFCCYVVWSLTMPPPTPQPRAGRGGSATVYGSGIAIGGAAGDAPAAGAPRLACMAPADDVYCAVMNPDTVNVCMSRDGDTYCTALPVVPR